MLRSEGVDVGGNVKELLVLSYARSAYVSGICRVVQSPWMHRLVLSFCEVYKVRTLLIYTGTSRVKRVRAKGLRLVATTTQVLV